MKDSQLMMDSSDTNGKAEALLGSVSLSVSEASSLKPVDLR